MLKRLIMLPVSLAAAAGVPFLALNDELKTQVSSVIGSFSNSNSDGSSDPAVDGEFLADVPSPFSRGVSVSGVNWNEDDSQSPFSFASDNRTSNNTYGQPRTNSSGTSNGGTSGGSGQRGTTYGSSSNSAPPLNSSSSGQPQYGQPQYGAPHSTSGSHQTSAQFVSGSSATTPELPNGWPAVPTLGSDLRQVIRFDVTPNWIKAHWPRVSVGWTEDGLEGFRVPLVTGTAVHDLTGALTYYFDSRHRVQRIRFVGNTGDASPLVDLCQRYYDMEIEPTRIAGYYTRRYHGRPVNVLRVTHDAVLRADAPNLQLNIVLELNNPQGDFNLSQATLDLLSTDPPLMD